MFPTTSLTMERYDLPSPVTRGLGWSTLGTINIGTVIPYLNSTTLMPENDGNLYAWKNEASPYGGNYVIQVGAIDVDGNLVLSGTPPPMTYHADEIVAVKSGETLYVPKDKTLTPGLGKFIAASDMSNPTYIGGVDNANRMSKIEGEGLLLANVIVAQFQDAGVLLSSVTERDCIIWNTFFDGTEYVSVSVDAAYAGTLQLINSNIDGTLSIASTLKDNLDIRNNKIMALQLLCDNMELSHSIRNNFILIVDDAGTGNILPTSEPIGHHWYGLLSLREMESYSGNIVGNATLPSQYGFLQLYGRTGIGVEGSLPYLTIPTWKRDPTTNDVAYVRNTDTEYKFMWNKVEKANDYLLNAAVSHTNPNPPYGLSCGDVDDFYLESQHNVLEKYPANNDGNQDGEFDTLFNLSLNNLWFFSLQARVLLGNKLLCHTSDYSVKISVPTYNTGSKIPNRSVGLMFPMQLKNGKWLVAEGKDSVRSGIFQTVMTNVGERLMHEHGAGLRSFLFEGQMDEDLFDIARAHMRAELETVEPRIRVQGISFTNQNQDDVPILIIEIQYIDLESGSTETFSTGIA